MKIEKEITWKMAEQRAQELKGAILTHLRKLGVETSVHGRFQEVLGYQSGNRVEATFVWSAEPVDGDFAVHIGIEKVN